MDDLGLINYIGDDTIVDDNVVPSFTETYHNVEDVFKNYETLKKNNITQPIMTRYEKTKVLGLRAEMLARGAQPLVTVPKHVSSTLRIAEMELAEKKIPFLLKRKTNNSFEYWKIEDLIIR